MHPQLAYHEHPQCQDVIAALEECHRASFWNTFLGRCNSIKADLNKCLSEEHVRKRQKNKQDAAERRKRIESIWKEIDGQK
ncbi:uncharacterized protein VTP21DRAFT_339 [Calcarisporiella thermophila]|uniref:uncharacterized protein n=1 Tax=Calcarisporiella thermophila TaxID=911321 RepID=UPI003742C30C